MCINAGHAVAGKEAGGARATQVARGDSAREDAAQAEPERAVSSAFGHMEALSGALAEP